MNYSWYTLLFLSFAWTAGIHIYQPPAWGILLFLILAALVSCILNFRAKSSMENAECVKNALLECFFILLVQGACLAVYIPFAARVHEEVIFAPAASALLNVFGIKTVVDGSGIFLDSFLGSQFVLSTIEKTGLLYLLLILAGGGVLLFLGKSNVRKLLLFSVTVIAYGVFRYAFLLMLTLSVSIHSMFWERIINFVTFIPLGILLSFAFRNQPLSDFSCFFKKGEKKHAVISGLLGFALLFSATAFFGWHDPGIEKEGRVLVDEYHSDWEWTTEEYDTNWFGQRSGYNYYCFYDYIDKFYAVERNTDVINEGTLKDIDVFIMKTPTLPFEEEEIQAMRSFVEQGGGLYLIGDHTNVFGTGTNLNQLSAHFDIRFNYDSTYELVNGTLSEYDAPKILPHPAIARLPHFLFATTNTLDAPWYAEEVIIGYGLQTYPVDYSQKNFFPEDSSGNDLEFGLFLQSVGTSYGKGRVLAFTDSTVYSNFWMFMPGKPELLLLSLEWLNKENTITGLTPRHLSLCFFTVILIITGVYGFLNRKKFLPGILLSCGIAGLVFGTLFFGAVNKQIGQLPEPQAPMVNICFENEYSQMKIPKDLEGFMAETDEVLSTFYVWTQRLGYYPSLETSLKDALADGDLVVIAKPRREIKNPEKIIRYMEEGGYVLILDNIETGANANKLLELVQMEIQEGTLTGYVSYDEIADVMLTENASIVVGGKALADDELGNAVLSVKPVGEGAIAVLSDPDLMYNINLGDVSANLTERTELLSQMEFKLIQSLINSDY